MSEPITLKKDVIDKLSINELFGSLEKRLNTALKNGEVDEKEHRVVSTHLNKIKDTAQKQRKGAMWCCQALVGLGAPGVLAIGIGLMLVQVIKELQKRKERELLEQLREKNQSSSELKLNPNDAKQLQSSAVDLKGRDAKEYNSSSPCNDTTNNIIATKNKNKTGGAHII